VEFEVPHGVTAQITDGLVIGRHGCASGAPGDAYREGKTFGQALRDPFEGRRTPTGRGTGRVRWAEFADGTAGDKDYTLFALDPRLVKPGETEQKYYGVEVMTASTSPCTTASR